MLILFRVKNFMSFKDDVQIDLRRTSYKEHPNHIFKFLDMELLKTVAVYGSNAAGKSNLVFAMHSFKMLVSTQFFNYNSEKAIDRTEGLFDFKPFKLTDNPSTITEFEIAFGYNNNVYQYQISYDFFKEIFEKEELIVNHDMVYQRCRKEVSIGNKYKKFISGNNEIREDRLYLAFLDYFSQENKIKSMLTEIMKFFVQDFNIHFDFHLNPTIKINRAIDYFNIEPFKDDEFRKRVSDLVRVIDVNIDDLEVQPIVTTNIATNETSTKYVLKAIHRVKDKDNNVKKIPFDLYEESNGTRKFITFASNIVEKLDKGGVYIVDELSNSLHPVLTKFIIDIFNSKLNVNHTQLVFTTHEFTIMNRNQFRRDEVVLIDKNDKGESSLYSLSDLKIRSDASFDKEYFKGKYGALPIIKDILSCEDKDD